METKKNTGLNISTKMFLTSILVIFLLMIVAYALTFIVPSGVFDRGLDGTIVSKDSYHVVEGGISFIKWIFSPFLLLGASGSGLIIAIIFFLLIIGGIFSVLTSFNLIQYMLDLIVNKYGKQKYKLLAIIILVFMLLGSFVGSFEEVTPLVPIVVALSIALGFDAFVGLSICLIAVSCGFASGIMNPFTVGVAQNLAGLSMFSGVWLRILSFVLIYGLLLLFTFIYARKVDNKKDEVYEQKFEYNENLNKSLLWFVIILGIGIAIIISSSFISFLRDYTMIIVALAFLSSGIVSSIKAKVSFKDFMINFKNGVLGILPASIMILMASSIKYTLEEAKTLDSIIKYAIDCTTNMNRFTIVLFIYLIVLVMNFFIASGSTKAFLLIPLIVPIAKVCGIPAQLCIVAYAFGDGFSNVFYPTNPVLLISLGLSNMDYPTYVKKSWKFQLANLVLTSFILLFGLLVNYH